MNVIQRIVGSIKRAPNSVEKREQNGGTFKSNTVSATEVLQLVVLLQVVQLLLREILDLNIADSNAGSLRGEYEGRGKGRARGQEGRGKGRRQRKPTSGILNMKIT